jgi:hypothetical protein
MQDQTISTQDKARLLEDVFGAVSIKQVSPGVYSASVPAFAKYGQNTFFMSRGGSSAEDAVSNLFDQAAQSAGRKSELEMDMMGRSRVFRTSDRKKIVFYSEPVASGNRGFKVTERIYSEPYFG